MTELHTIRTSENKETPHGTIIELRLAAIPGHVHVRLQLPGQWAFSDLGDLPIINGIVTLPLKLVFLCHAHEDRIVIKSISERLWQDGFLTWLDERELLPGDEWKAVIEDAIERSDFVLIFLSNVSISKKGYVQREMKYALEKRQMRPYGERYIIPVLIEPCQPPKPFHDIQWLELWQENAFDKLKQAMK